MWRCVHAYIYACVHVTVCVCVSMWLRCDQCQGRNGQPTGVAADGAINAAMSALKYAQQVNAYLMVTGAQLAATEAWLQVGGCTCVCMCVCVCVSTRSLPRLRVRVLALPWGTLRH